MSWRVRLLELIADRCAQWPRPKLVSFLRGTTTEELRAACRFADDSTHDSCLLQGLHQASVGFKCSTLTGSVASSVYRPLKRVEEKSQVSYCCRSACCLFVRHLVVPPGTYCIFEIPTGDNWRRAFKMCSNCHERHFSFSIHVIFSAQNNIYLKKRKKTNIPQLVL